LRTSGNLSADNFNQTQRGQFRSNASRHLNYPFSEAKLKNIAAHAMNMPSDGVEDVNQSCGNCTFAAVAACAHTSRRPTRSHQSTSAIGDADLLLELRS